MIFSGSHFGVINPFHPLLAKLSGLMMVSTCLCYHHCWLHPVRVRGEILLGAVWSSRSRLDLEICESHHSPITLQSLPVGGVGVDVGDVGGGVGVVVVRQGQYSP